MHNTPHAVCAALNDTVAAAAGSPTTAVDLVRESLRQFLALDSDPIRTPLQMLHAVSAALHHFAEAVDACGARRPDPERLQPYLAGARELHARSSFVSRLQL